MIAGNMLCTSWVSNDFQNDLLFTLGYNCRKCALSITGIAEKLISKTVLSFTIGYNCRKHAFSILSAIEKDFSPCMTAKKISWERRKCTGTNTQAQHTLLRLPNLILTGGVNLLGLKALVVSHVDVSTHLAWYSSI